MNREEFLEAISDILQVEEEISFETILDELDEWDSLAAISIIAFLNKTFGVKITAADVVAFQTVEDIAQKAGI